MILKADSLNFDLSLVVLDVIIGYEVEMLFAVKAENYECRRDKYNEGKYTLKSILSQGQNWRPYYLF